jgi:hypothetical protein
MINEGMFGPVHDGLVRYWCDKCDRAPADTLPGSRVVCNRGHECKQVSK